MNTRTNLKRGLALVLTLLMIACCFAACGSNASSGTETSGTSSTAEGSSAAATEGGKTITLTVVHKDGSSKDFTIKTDAENLRNALEQEKLVEGEEGDYGLYVKTVDGETVNDANEEWWCLTKGGAQVNTGVDDTKIADGEAYEFTFTTGYDQ